MNKGRARYLKVQLYFLVYILLGGFAAYGLFQWVQLSQYQTNLKNLSQKNIQRINSLQKAQTSLFVFHNATTQWFRTGDIKWDNIATEAKGVYLKEMRNVKKGLSLNLLEKSKVDAKPLVLLQKTLDEWKTNNHNEQLIPKLLGETSAAVDAYFLALSKRVTQHMARNRFDPKIKLNKESSDLGFIFSGFSALNQFFFQTYLGSINQQLDILPKLQKKLALYLGVMGGFILFVALFLTLQVLSYIRRNESRSELLVQMGSRDLVTGLLNRRVFEGLVGQEIERAKRKGLPVSLLFVNVAPLDQIVQDFGRPACEHLLFQISEFLKKICRNYDGIFSYDRETFVILLAEASSANVGVVIDRLRKKLENKEFYIGLSNDVIQPRLHFGHASYPQHGEDLKALVQQGMSELFSSSNQTKSPSKMVASTQA